jgi:photosystem II stability/assembly factor-like uncharacterized protein
MHPKIYISISLLVMVMLACNLVKVPVTGTPVVPTDTPNPPISTQTSSPTMTVGIVPAPTASGIAVVPSPALTHVAFQDAKNGWGVTSNDSGYIVRTVDGGSTWLNVTPPGLTGLGYSTTLSVLDVNTVWVLVPNADFFTGRLFSTTDGGNAWNSYDVPFGGGVLQFLNASTGRVLADRGAGAGSQSVELFQTSDGGASWMSVFNDDPTRPDSSGTLPLSGIKNGMTFIDANTGWVTGTRPVDGEVYLFVTHDGGVSWEQQLIPLPSGYGSYQYMPQSPIFFGNDGYLPLVIYLTGLTELTFYTTHDGGNTWTGDPTNANMVIQPGQYSFADATHAWGWDGGSNLYFTSDGGQMWGGLATSLDLSGRLSQIVFVPGTGGQFIGWALTGPDDAGHSQLYKTSDNGGTWTALLP